MAIELPDLPYAKDALEPQLSAETLEVHHDKHHKAYVDTTNQLIEGTDFENMALIDIIQQAEGKLFNQAAQVWNHSFYWQCMSPEATQPAGRLAEAIERDFGSVDALREKFIEAAKGNFASGWTWLVQARDGTLAVVNTDDADTPIRDPEQRPLLACDVWEHAYYIDYRNRRPDYLNAFWQLVNWDFVGRNLEGETELLQKAA